jgi:hypothetical protein
MAATVTPAASPARPRGAGRRAGQVPEEGRQLQPSAAEAGTRQGEMVGSKWVSWNRLALPVSAAVNKPDPAQLAFPLIPLVRLFETVAPRWVRGAVVTKRPERERQDCQDDTDTEPTPDVHDAMIVHGSPQGSGTDDAGGLCGVDSAGADPGAGAPPPGQRPRRRHDDQLPKRPARLHRTVCHQRPTHHRPTAPSSGPTNSSGAAWVARPWRSRPCGTCGRRPCPAL